MYTLLMKQQKKYISSVKQLFEEWKRDCAKELISVKIRKEKVLHNASHGENTEAEENKKILNYLPKSPQNKAIGTTEIEAVLIITKKKQFQQKQIRHFR